MHRWALLTRLTLTTARKLRPVIQKLHVSRTSHGVTCYLPIRVDLLWIAMTTNGGTYTKQIKRMAPAPQTMSKKAAPIPTRSVAANCTRRLARGRWYRGLVFHSGICRPPAARASRIPERVDKARPAPIKRMPKKKVTVTSDRSPVGTACVPQTVRRLAVRGAVPRTDTAIGP